LFSGLLPISALPGPPPAFVGDADYSVARRDAFGVVDMRIGLESETWSIVAYAENLFNEKYLNEVITAVEFGGSFISPGGRQRFGVELGYKF
jgi:iron complex outermembrane receptor protein